MVNAFSPETSYGEHAKLGKPVITCNQATLWAALRAAGIDDRLEDCGLLLKKY
tara:strand:- start:447 stop:605 length:159 start_codon:yes stop_codon:yes gene_type:complete